MQAAQQKCYKDQGLYLEFPMDPTNPDHVKNAATKNQLASPPEQICKWVIFFLVSL